MAIDYNKYYRRYLDEIFDDAVHTSDWLFFDCLVKSWINSGMQCSVQEYFYINGLPEYEVYTLTGFILGLCNNIQYVIDTFDDQDIVEWANTRGFDSKTMLSAAHTYIHSEVHNGL